MVMLSLGSRTWTRAMETGTIGVRKQAVTATVRCRIAAIMVTLSRPDTEPCRRRRTSKRSQLLSRLKRMWWA